MQGVSTAVLAFTSASDIPKLSGSGNFVAPKALKGSVRGNVVAPKPVHVDKISIERAAPAHEDEEV